MPPSRSAFFKAINKGSCCSASPGTYKARRSKGKVWPAGSSYQFIFISALEKAKSNCAPKFLASASFCTTRFISEIFPLRSEYRMWPSPPTERHCRFWISSSSFVRKVAASFSRRAARSLAFAAPSFAAAILALALAISACATPSEALASTVLVSSSAVRHSVCRSFTPPNQNWTKRKTTVVAAATAVSKPAINIPYQEISNQRLADCNNAGSTGSDSQIHGPDDGCCRHAIWNGSLCEQSFRVFCEKRSRSSSRVLAALRSATAPVNPLRSERLIRAHSPVARL